MTEIELRNVKQLKKFCPFINRKCRFDCNFFQSASWQPFDDDIDPLRLNYLAPAKCTFKDK